MLVNLRRRAEILASIRRFFDERDYLEVETPVMVPSPGLDLHLDAFAVEGGGYLITSPEYQMKQLLAEGAARIFQLVRCFRRGERGRHHNPEFTMLEWYRAGATMEDMMAETEALVGGFLERPFRSLSVAEAFLPHDVLALDEDSYFRILVDEVEPKLRQGAVFLHDYPASQASLARLRDDDPRFCERFELYVDGIELCNGFGELTDPVEQRRRLEADQAERRTRGLPVYPIDEDFLAALEKGIPACAGNALGVDRLVMLALGGQRIGEAMALT